MTRQNLELFTENNIIGVFKGFSNGGLEFHADLALPYRNDFQSIPMHGQFLIVQLENPNEAVLGRITASSSGGKLSSGSGEEFNIRAVKEGRPIPENLREQYLKYRIDIRVLGVIRTEDRTLNFVASHRRLPHVGSPVAFLTDTVLQELLGHNASGATIGQFALGEYIYSGGSPKFKVLPWMQLKEPIVNINFPISNLVARRTFIFARAGFGKSNLNKLLFAELYKNTPTVEKRNGKEVPVGTVLFDPDGEYFWPDDRGRPGLCDVEHLEDKLVVFTNRKAPSKFYQSFVVGGIRLDIRRLRPSDVISIAIPSEKQNQQNINKLRGLRQNKWEELVDAIHEGGNQTEIRIIKDILSLAENQEAEAYAARSNMTIIIRQIHDPNSIMLDALLFCLKNGKLCIIDVSQMRGKQSLILSGIILRKIFDHNQEQFTNAEPETIPTIAVVEEAQAVLSDSKSAANEPYVSWVKEGRKYDLGAVLITQQPGSISGELLSQGDNWFVFHLISSSDLSNIKNANAHFSQDILSSLLNEPIPGQGIFWSSAGSKPFPLSLRVKSFEASFSTLDPNYDRPPVETFVPNVRKEIYKGFEDSGEASDLKALRYNQAVDSIRNNQNVHKKINTEKGIAWGELNAIVAKTLPDSFDNKEKTAYNWVSKILDEVFGPQNSAWTTHQPDGKATYCKLVNQ